MRDANVQMARRFVEQQNRRLLREAQRDPDALALAALSVEKRRSRKRLDADRGKRALDRARRRPPFVCHCHQRWCGKRPIATTSRTRSASSSTSSPVTSATRCARSSGPSLRVRDTVQSKIVPRLGACSPAIARSSVVLPTPFGPSTATNSPRRDARLDSFEQRTSADSKRDAAQLDHRQRARIRDVAGRR